ncbi:YifB family Mg chelatase-like AAA ATPase [Schaalia vaccimaxillae]|uniref:YifB family Mg chelatase-like AAA ATPase n=1 Tax=Schaalia vaccimaxillae TaxID=183916 RepID=UPI0003B702D5|nr:YifB family Mg chelatase-like AAA ATPase [Schaalia vaccimaxillae]
MSAVGSLATTISVALIGLDGHLVQVETHVGRGLVGFTLVGLPDASLREAKDRVKSAIQSCGLEAFDSKITVNLSPAGLPKSGSGFDLAIAASVLIAAGKVPASAFQEAVIIGELGLDGSLRAIKGLLPALVGAAKLGIHRAIVPAECMAEAQLVPGLEVQGFAHLADVVTWAGGTSLRPTASGSRATTIDEGDLAPISDLDLSDIRGQGRAIEALEVAAAGGHHMFLIGEPGAGKTMLASRLVTILPDLDDQTALETTCVHSLVGRRPQVQLMRNAPLQSPHHSATMAALIGGGASGIVPGAVSLAHGGVLVLDEAAEFAPSVLDALRQPLEEGSITIHRAKGHARFPARFQLVLASNPCPCGGSRRGKPCTCSSVVRRRYMSRLSGPLLDRIDITVPMRAPTRVDLAEGPAPKSSQVRSRVEAARERASHRLKDTPWTLNAQLPGTWIREVSGIDEQVCDRLDRAVDDGILSMRGADRVLRLMWTLADLEERSAPDSTDLARALALRTGDPNGDR